MGTFNYTFQLMQASGKTVTSSHDAASYMDLVHRYNDAIGLMKINRLHEAEILLRDVLNRQSHAGFDELAIALTQNELGRVLRHLGALDEALELLTKALEVRDRADEAAGSCIALRDGNLTRNEIAKVYEAMGDCTKALAIREPGKRICSNEACEAFDYLDGELLACSRCKCVFYCGKTCQRHDWKTRHKLLCQEVKMEKMLVWEWDQQV
ncbi:hypothetical protein KXD40_005828 [Peronospora effusa]|uniref:phytol kinase n=1 Tax=Peronospora effusa TaxID=542832 RepID=A0A3M6VAA9_9STRA|nr:hypothetical protein DD238_004856 [Peronospora effusa]UIZ27641.1 hypothetical protein KXD40_005828 [Peronospora effusa]